MGITRMHLMAALFWAAALATGARPASAQDDCKMLFCAPQLTFQPSLTVVPAFRTARVERLRDGVAVDTVGIESKAQFALLLGLSIPSTIPRTSFFVNAYWLPFAATDENAFTEYTADELNERDLAANSPVLELGASVTLLKSGQTNGWLSVSGQVLDQFGPAAEPDDRSDYTHKLNLAVQSTARIFRWVPEDNWLRNVQAYASVEYTATGLPDAGDVVPDGERRWLEDASPWQLWTGLVIPLAPIAP